MRKILFFLCALCTCFFAPKAQATNVFTVTNSQNVFTITRTDASQKQMVKYRTVSLSAVAGQHFTSASGSLTFNAGDTEKTVTVTELDVASADTAYRYLTGTQRSYRLEVTDDNGFFLASKDRSMNYSSAYRMSANYQSTSITNLVYFTNNGGRSSDMSSTAYYDVPYAASSNTDIKVTDSGYKQAVHTVSTSSFFNQVGATQEYLKNRGCQLYATVCFTEHEKNDGYQYIQVLTDNSSTYDGNDANGAVSTPSTSIYKACFILSKTASTMTSDHYQFFPHRYDYVNKASEKSANLSKYEFDYDDSYLYQQAFKSSDYQASTSGSFVLSPMVNSLSIRFDAAGSDDDDWYFKNMFVRFALRDAKAPSLKTSEILVSPGPNRPGQLAYVTLSFDEIVKVTGTPTLTTTWGTLTYIAGSGTNALTFADTITCGIGKALKITGLTGMVTDLAGNSFSGSLNISRSEKTDKYSLTSLNTTINGLSDTPYRDDNVNKPAVTVTYSLNGKDTLLTEGTDYTVSYGNVNFGSDEQVSVAVTVSGTGNFSGSVSKNYTVRKINEGDFEYLGSRRYAINSLEDFKMLQLFFKRSYISSVDTFVQTVDINYDGSCDPMGNSERMFWCSYDGQGHTLSGITINKPSGESVGIFGYVYQGAVIRNLVVSNSTITGQYHVGAIVGYCSGKILNCRVESSVTVRAGHNSETNYNHGGIAGRTGSGCVIEGCVSAAKIRHNNYKNSNNFGGIVGYTESATKKPVLKNNMYVGTTIDPYKPNSTDVVNKGAIVGRDADNGPSYSENYYTIDGIGAVANADKSGARKACSVTIGDEHVSIVGGDTTRYDVSGLAFVGNYGVIRNEVLYSCQYKTIPLSHTDRPYYSFVAYTYNDGTEHVIDGTSFAMPNASVTIGAQWSAVEFAITYVNAVDGENEVTNTNPTVYTIESEFNLAEPTRTGYTFDGWTYEGQDTPTKSVTIEAGTTGELTFTANWTKQTPTGIDENSQQPIANSQKLIKDGQLLIIRNGRTYNAQGAEVR